MSTGTSPSSAAEQARLRRERREKKILAQGSSRLEKIAGLQGGATARETLHPDPPEHDISSVDDGAGNVRRSAEAATKTRGHGHAASPGSNLFEFDGGDEDPFNMLRGSNDSFENTAEELKNDPMMKLLLSNPMFSQGMPPPGGRASSGVEGGTSKDSSA